MPAVSGLTPLFGNIPSPGRTRAGAPAGRRNPTEEVLLDLLKATGTCPKPKRMEVDE